ncbi:DUF3970 family protein [Hazenella coriacea]|uniref:Uncharacterized protein DUF3970 n=1 Tax=Hazenella coriacea TaxID=1179467 RepID=A0A4R3L4H3_9BACL|nr:DUF3970 family protein [Hazenella coriacea]TCS94671.1 uncharacterized protein DUF3970 [Hazenella coriacea]
MLKIRVMGKADLLNHFMSDFKSHPQYQIKLESKSYPCTPNNEGMVFANFEFKPRHRRSLTVTLFTTNNKELELNLLDGQAVEIDQGVTFINGKVLDIFS